MSFNPGYVVIANETSAHRSALLTLRKEGFAGTALVEKPLFELIEPKDLVVQPGTFVAYNLRFHPLLERLKQWLDVNRPIAASIYAGQHLSTWRHGRDFRVTYSAISALGGGVLRDLSHELDYISWLFGRWKRVAALGGASRALNIDVDDYWSILLECVNCPQVALTLSYLDTVPRRQIVVNSESATAILDFVAGTLLIAPNDPIRYEADRDGTYRRQHEAILSNLPTSACTYAEGVAVVQLVNAIETAAQQRRWIESD